MLNEVSSYVIYKFWLVNIFVFFDKFQFVFYSMNKCFKNIFVILGIFGVLKWVCVVMYIKVLFDFLEKIQKLKLKEFYIIDNKVDMLDLICEEYEESYKNGRKYLELKRVFERL